MEACLWCMVCALHERAGSPSLPRPEAESVDKYDMVTAPRDPYMPAYKHTQTHTHYTHPTYIQQINMYSTSFTR